MNADVSGNAVHLDICDRSFQRFLIKVQFLDIDMIVFEGFPDVILTAQIVRTMPFKFVYKSKCLFIRALKDKVDVIGHQNESKDNHSMRICDERDGIHGGFEIILVPKPDTRLKMIRCYKIESHSL
jgi:hypothetical protein